MQLFQKIKSISFRKQHYEMNFIYDLECLGNYFSICKKERK